MKIIESTNDPRSEYFDLMRRESIPADELMGRRMEIGVVAVLGQLRAKRNWHRIAREWIYRDGPATELGKAAKEIMDHRFDYTIDIVKLLFVAALIAFYFWFMLSASAKEYRDVIAERFGDKGQG